MIIPMLKYSFLVYHKDYTPFLEELRRHGVVHVIGSDEELTDRERERMVLMKQIQHVVRELARRNTDGVTPDGIAVSGEEAFADVLAILDRQEEVSRSLSQLVKEINQVKPWGNFSPASIEALANKGITLRFYTVPVRKYDEAWTFQWPIEVIGNHAGMIYFVLADDGSFDTLPDADEMRPPGQSLSGLNNRQESLRQEQETLKEKLNQHAGINLEAIRQYGYQVMDDTSYHHVLNSTTADSSEKVRILEGWVPEERQDELVAFLESQNILYVKEKPVKGEKVPVLLKNKKFSKDFEQLGELYSLPEYRELDMTPFFAPFYLIFFGFCLGDAGYGVLMMLAALLLKRKVRKELKSTMNLIFYLGISTIAFGVLGGTLFGIPLYETGLPVYSKLAADFEARGTDVNTLLFYLALLLGGIQIMFGMFLKSVNEIRQYGVKYAIGTFGWIILLLGSVVIALLNQVEGVPMEQLNIYLYALLGVSGVMILLLNTPGKNVFMNVGIGIWNTYNMATGILGDLLSYIRLFALGIASAIMGFVFNSLAVEMSGSIPVVSTIVMVIILVIGHSINIFMSGLGAFVHPLRLTFVEFYKNAGFNGGGKKYNPFRKLS